jgi:hypothetical protein
MKERIQYILIRRKDMKKHLLIFIVLVLIIPISTFAEEKTIVGDGIDHGGYGAPVLKFMSIGGDLGVIVGGRGGWIINHTIVIGGGYYGLANDITIEGRDLQMDYGGFEIEYIWRSDSVVHFTIHTGIGGGKVEMVIGGFFQDKFFYIEPTFNGEINLMSWFRINAGVGYFWVDNIQGMPGLSSSDVRGITGTIVFKFGWF